MKKIKLILPIAIFIVLILSTIVNANTTNITLNASSNKIEDEIEITINLNDLQTEGAKLLTGKIEFDETVLEYVGKSFKSGWNGAVSDDGTSFNAFGYEETTNNEVLTLTFKLKEDVKLEETKVAIKDLKLVVEESTEEQSLQNTEINFEIVSKTNNLPIIIIALVLVAVVIAVLVIVFIKKKKQGI